MTTRLAAEVWRDFIVDGVPSTLEHKPKKSDIRLWGTEIEDLLSAQLTGGGLMYATKSALDADLAKAAGTGAWVYEDPAAANNGIWRKIGASGTGSWTRAGDLPYSVIGLEITGGTANAIECASALPVPQAARRALYILVPGASNTGAVTLAVNGASAKALKWQAGEALANGHLQTGVPVLFFDNGSEFRLTQDDSFAGMLAGAQNAATLASQWAVKTDGNVADGDASAKAYAVGGSGVSGVAGRGAAKEWALKTDGAVADSEYSAKAYALGGTGVTNTAGGGAAKEWATKASGQTVDGTEYSAKHYALAGAASAVLAAAWASAPQNEVVSGGLYSARHYSLAAASSAANAAADRAIAATAANNAMAASLFFGPFQIYNTKALADAAVAGMPADQPVMVFADETRGGARAYYRKESGSLVFKGLADDRVVSSITLYAPATPTAVPLSATGFTNGVPVNLALGETAGPDGLTGMRKQWHFGYNFGAISTRIDASEPAAGFSIAINQFNYDGLPYGNAGFGVVSNTGVQRPIFSLEWPHHTSDGTDVRVQGYLRANKFAFYNWDASKMVFQLDPTIDRILMGSMTFRQPNNVRFLEAVNAAGTGSVEVLTYDNSDRIRTAGALYLLLPATLTQPAINIAPAGTALPDEWPAVSVVASSTSVTNGNLYAVNAVLNCQGPAKFNVQNNANFTNAGVQATWQALYGNTGADIWHTFSNIGVGGTANNWSFGIDQSASKFTFAAATSLGSTSTDILSLFANGHVYLKNVSAQPTDNPLGGPNGVFLYAYAGEMFWRDAAGVNNKISTLPNVTQNADRVLLTLPLKLASHNTVAGLPAAGTAGAGSLIWVSNAGGGAVPAYSDGSMWRRGTDGTEISA